MSGADVVRGWASDVRRFADDWPRQGGAVLARAVVDQLNADTGDGRLSHDRRGGVANVEVTAGRASADVTGAGSIGTWVILESGTRAHPVTGKGTTGVVRTPYGPRRTVTVRGARARQTWTRGVDRGMDAVEADATRAWATVT